MGVVKDHQLAIGEALNVGFNPTRTNRCRGIKRYAGILRVSTAGAAVGADLLVGKIRLRQLDARPYP